MTELREEMCRDLEERQNAETSIIRVAVVDEETLSRMSTVQVIDTQPDLLVVGTASSGSDAVRMTEELQPEVVMLDLSSPEVGGETITRTIVEAGNAHPAVLVMTDGADETVALAAIRAGASGVCAKVDPPEVVVQSVRSIAAGEISVSSSILGHLVRRLHPKHPAELDTCSKREIEVLALIAEGLTNPEIATRLFISEATVRSHVQALRRKLGVRNRVDLVVFAHRAGIVEHP